MKQKKEEEEKEAEGERAPSLPAAANERRGGEGRVEKIWEFETKMVKVGGPGGGERGF